MDELSPPLEPFGTHQHKPQQARRRFSYAFWIVIGAILMIFVSGWIALAGYRYVNANLGALLRPSRDGRTPLESDVPAAKTDLYGTRAGLKIIGVVPNSVASRVGLRYGDVMIAYNKRPVTNEDEIDAVMSYFQRQHDRTGKPTSIELSLYRDGDMTVKTLQVPIGKLGIYTHEWTFAGAFVEDAIVDRDNYAAAEKYTSEAAASGQYTDDQILHMRMLCVNNDKDGDNIRQIQVDELYGKYPAEKLTLFGNYDLLHHKRHRAAAAVFERYLKIKKVDVSTELNLASCYTEIDKLDEAEALITTVLNRSADDPDAPSEYGLSVLSNIRAKLFMGRRQYADAQAGLAAALDRYPDDSYYTLAYLYCAMRRDASGQKPGEFEAAYKMTSARSHETERLMGYHLDALRAFILVKHNRVADAQAAVARWRDSADAKRYIPIFWNRFPDGNQIIDNWNALSQ
jgi:tetratricopeptide (TPR) repeat protein